MKKFQHWGIATPKIIAFNEKRKFGKFISGFLITEECPHTENLITIAKQQPELLQNKLWLRNLIHTVATYTKCMHQHKFIHSDLKWRNILVTTNNNNSNQNYNHAHNSDHTQNQNHNHNHNQIQNQTHTQNQTPQVYFIDCPMGHRRHAFRLRHGIIKDLACLDKYAKRFLSKSQRMRFYHHYIGHNKLTPSHKRHIRKILNFKVGQDKKTASGQLKDS